MNPFLLTPDERLASWKTLRKSLPALPEDQQLSAVATYWAQAPLMRHAYIPDAPETWPSPWEMVHDGSWCRNSTAIGMEMTLRLAGWDHSRMTLQLIRENLISEEFLVLQIDEKYILNYHHGIVALGFGSEHEVLVTMQFNGKLYSRVSY